MSFHFQYPRAIPARRPGDFEPAAPKFQARWEAPVTTVVSDYLAIQHSIEDLTSPKDFFNRFRIAFAGANGPDCFEEMRHIDDTGSVNSIVIAYWTDVTRFARWKHLDPVNAWFRSSEREQESVGYWRETLVVPYDRFETIYAEPHYRVGLGRTKACELEPMYTAGYFGAMRDRLPISAVDPLNSPFGEAIPEGNFAGARPQRIRIDVPPNLVSIRSGQYWQKAESEQLDDYLENLQPKLEVGMTYLQDHAETTGCMSLRAMVNLDENGKELKETSKHGYFLSLEQLERWASSHKSHLDIFKHALAMRKKYGSNRSVVTWHEVFVLGTTPSFEYINCHVGTGLLRFANIWGVVVSQP